MWDFPLKSRVGMLWSCCGRICKPKAYHGCAPMSSPRIWRLDQLQAWDSREATIVRCQRAV